MKTYELGGGGSTFLKSLLKRGDRLARALDGELFSEGRLFTFLPDLADPEKVSLTEGGLSGFISDWNPDWPIEQIIADDLREPNRFFVMELDTIPREAAIRLYAGKTFQFFVSRPCLHTFADVQGEPAQEEGVGVYGYVNHANEDMENVRDLIVDHRAFGAIGVLSSAASLPSGGSESDPAIFPELAANARYVLGTAYDDFGWIVWARNDLPESFRIEGNIF